MFEKQIIEKINKLEDLDHLVEFPELYDYIYSDVFSFDKREKLVENYSRGEDNAIILGVGSGLFAEKIENDYKHIVGVDINEEMLELCSKRCNDIDLIRKDIINNLDIKDNNFDLALMLGNVSAVFSVNQMERLFNNVFNVLGNSGTFVFDFLDENDKYPSKNEDIIKSDEFTVRRKVNLNPHGNCLKSFMEYNIIYKENTFSFNEEFSMKMFNPHELEEILSEKFSNVEFLTSIDYDRGVIVAEK